MRLKSHLVYPLCSQRLHLHLNCLVLISLPKNSRNSGWDVNGRDFLVLSVSGINGIPEKVVPFSRWKLPNGKFVFHLQISRLYCFYHQFHTFRGLLSGQASLGSPEWNLWQMERAFPKRNSQQKFSEIFCKWKPPVSFTVWEALRETRLFFSLYCVQRRALSSQWFCYFLSLHSTCDEH